MVLTARLPEWMFRRRRRSFHDEPMRLPSKQEVEDRRACQGKDRLDAAVNWMRHVVDRDFEYPPEIMRAVVVIEVGRGPGAQTLYTTHRVDATPVEVRGLLAEGLRGNAETVSRANRHADIEMFAKALAPQLQELVSEKAEAVVSRFSEALAKEEEIEEAGRERLVGELRDRLRDGEAIGVILDQLDAEAKGR